MPRTTPPSNDFPLSFPRTLAEGAGIPLSALVGQVPVTHATLAPLRTLVFRPFPLRGDTLHYTDYLHPAPPCLLALYNATVPVALFVLEYDPSAQELRFTPTLPRDLLACIPTSVLNAELSRRGSF